jgi:hypothetical protein
MKNKDDIQKELQELSPFLSKLKAQEKQPEVPENYFYALPDQLWEQIKLQPAPERFVQQPSAWERFLRSVQILLQPRIALSLATFAALVVAGIYFLQPQTTTSSTSGDLTAEDITNYIDNNLHEFDTDLLIQATADLPNQSLLPTENLSDDDIDAMMKELVKEVDEKTIEELL